MDWILSLEDKSKDYAQRLYEVYLAGGQSSITYPETYPFNAPKGSLRNPLTPQLKLIARILAGGCKTKVFMVKIGGFDTHADQVEKYDPTMGGHAALDVSHFFRHECFSAGSSRQRPGRTRAQCHDFGVRTEEFNPTEVIGTDHGTGGPLFIFGQGAEPGVVGKVPDLSQGNVEMQFDYRLIYANLMKDWMLVDDTSLNKIFPGIMTAAGTSDGVTFENLPLAQQIITGTEGFIGDRFALKDCYPNPAKEKTTVNFMLNSHYHVTVNLMNSMGKEVKVMVDGVYEPGEHNVEVDLVRTTGRQLSLSA